MRVHRLGMRTGAQILRRGDADAAGAGAPAQTVSKVSKVGAKHVGHGVGVSLDLRRRSGRFRKLLSYRGERCRDQIGGQCARGFGGLGQRLLHEDLQISVSRRLRLLRPGRIAIERSGGVERNANIRLLTFRPDEGVDQGAQPFERRSADVLEHAAQKSGSLPPFVGLKPEQNPRLVREILIERSDAHPRLLGDTSGSEAVRAFPRQNLNRSLQNSRDKFARTSLLRLFSRGNLGASAFGHGGARQRE